MSKLIVCCDGTWNTPDQEEYELPAPTNVLRFYNALAASDGFRPQYKYYHPGVGTEGSFLQRTAGGMYGAGLAENVLSAYAWIGRHYSSGDKIYLFGFSRGAFTVRSLGGMLSRCGILDLRRAVDPFPDEIETALVAAEAWKRVTAAYEKGYRLRDPHWRDASWDLSAPPRVPIELVGVWDTVGALGIPDDMALFNVFDKPQSWSFHDTTLGENTRYARHAIAMDEMRASFTPTLWTDAQGRPLHEPQRADGAPARVRQIYFPGVHSDVGGGYYERGLAEGGLKWMIEEAAALPDGLVFDPKFTAQIAPDPLAPIHNSVRGLFKALKTRPRNLPAFSDEDRYHASALTRLKSPPLAQSPYFAPARIVPPGQPPGSPIPPSNVPSDRILKAAGESARCNVYAVNPWNATGLYLEAGVDYIFEAVGEWVDSTIACGPGGMDDGRFHPGELAQLAGSFFGQMEKLWKTATGNKQADFPMTKRLERAPWFSLVGAVANDFGAGKLATQNANDGTTPDHQYLLIGARLGPIRLSEPGHLYAFANDAWHFYDNNRGSVTLRVTRVT